MSVCVQSDPVCVQSDPKQNTTARLEHSVPAYLLVNKQAGGAGGEDGEGAMKEQPLTGGGKRPT